MQDLKITLIQTSLIWEDKKSNLRMLEDKIMSIQEPTDLIILPEMFSTGFVITPQTLAEPWDGPAFQWMKLMASHKGCAITGSIIVEDQGKYFNRLYWITADGFYRMYDKRHLFRMGKEHESFSMGKARSVIDYKGWKILPLICYDLRFPVWSKNRYINGKYEYDLLIYAANWPAVRSNIWKNLLMARSIENLAYVAGVNRVGVDGNNVDHSGDSCVIEPSGKILLSIPPGMEKTANIILSMEDLQQFRENFNAGLDWDNFTIQF